MLPGIARFTQLSPTSESVIKLGHKANVPLIGSPSELLDGSEPHGLIPLTARAREHLRGSRGCMRGVPGVVAGGGYREGAVPGTTQPSRLRLISKIF